MIFVINGDYGMEKVNKKATVIKLSYDNYIRYFAGFDKDDKIQSFRNIQDAKDLSSLSSSQINDILNKITSKPCIHLISINVVEYSLEYSTKEHIDNSFKIKNAINKLTKEEIELLGLEEIAFESILSNQYTDPSDISICDDIEADCDDEYCYDDVVGIIERDISNIIKYDKSIGSKEC